MMRAAIIAIMIAAIGCAVEDATSTATGALGSGGPDPGGPGSGPPGEPGAGSGSGMEDMPHDPVDPCAGQFPWTMCIADLNTWQKAPYVDSCWVGAPAMLPVHTTMEVVVTCYDHKPKPDGDQCKWETTQWAPIKAENINHGTSTSAVCDHGPRIGEPLLIKTRTSSMFTDPEGGLALLGATACTCDGFNTFMGADSLQPGSPLIGQVITALGNTDCDLTNMSPAELAAAVVSMIWYGNYNPLWQCAGDAVQQIRKGLHACNNDAAVEQEAFWRGGECPAADQLPGLCEGPRWYF